MLGLVEREFSYDMAYLQTIFTATKMAEWSLYG